MERYRTCILANYTVDNYCGRHAVVYLCATHLVFVLSNGHHFSLGGSSKSTVAHIGARVCVADTMCST